MRLHPDYPVVSGTYRVTAEWSLTLRRAMNRRIEDGRLVLWRPGLTAWILVWCNDHNESKSERLQAIRADVSIEAKDIRFDPDGSPAVLSYLLEDEGNGAPVALYGFAVADSGHIQMAFYCDSEPDLNDARAVFASLSIQDS